MKITYTCPSCNQSVSAPAGRGERLLEYDREAESVIVYNVVCPKCQRPYRVEAPDDGKQP